MWEDMDGSIHFIERFSPLESLELLQIRRITWWVQIPTMFQMVASRLPEFDRPDPHIAAPGWLEESHVAGVGEASAGDRRAARHPSTD